MCVYLMIIIYFWGVHTQFREFSLDFFLCVVLIKFHSPEECLVTGNCGLSTDLWCNLKIGANLVKVVIRFINDSVDFQKVLKGTLIVSIS